MEAAVSTLNGVATQHRPETEFSLFGRQVGLQLAELPPIMAIQLQLDIQQMLAKARLGLLQENSTVIESNANEHSYSIVNDTLYDDY